MPTTDDLRKGQAIADWNIAHGAVLAEITNACGALSTACEDAVSSPSANTYADVRNAGQRLAAVSTQALAGPWAGVPEFDDPRRAALNSYRQAGELTTDVQPNDAGHAAALEAAALLEEGTTVTNWATRFANDLVRRLTRPTS